MSAQRMDRRTNIAGRHENGYSESIPDFPMNAYLSDSLHPRIFLWREDLSERKRCYGFRCGRSIFFLFYCFHVADYKYEPDSSVWKKLSWMIVPVLSTDHGTLRVNY